jgi:three-Cys-motif partner protein
LSRELADDDPEKWAYTAHARTKHAIQWKYLGAWLAILGSRFPRLLIFDGFAGRGRYSDSAEGSPLIFWRRFVEAVEGGRPKSVAIRCVELNRNNLDHLEEELRALHHPQVAISAVQGSFADKATEAADTLRSQGNSAPPTFWTADPYGFKGVPLDTIRRLMSIPRSEVMLTFMVRDMRRFLDQENFERPLNEFFGGEAWRECLRKIEPADREECLLLRYSALVREGIAEFATPFRVFEDERRQTLYYLVHLSNHGLGMREMKKAMIRESPDMTFWPVTLRPPDQLALDVSEQSPFPRLQAHLSNEYGGQTMQFEQLLNRDYPVGFWLEPDYRAAILDMEQHQLAQVSRDRTTPKLRKPSGLKLEDQVRFEGQLSLG